jgi:hypothetical protein
LVSFSHRGYLCKVALRMSKKVLLSLAVRGSVGEFRCSEIPIRPSRIGAFALFRRFAPFPVLIGMLSAFHGDQSGKW